METKKIRCKDCKHFYISWDPRFPKGCRALNFKSKEEPSAVVFRNSGEQCHFFSPKKKKTKQVKKPPISIA